MPVPRAGKGGRAQNAPYETAMLRAPKPFLPALKQITNLWRYYAENDSLDHAAAFAETLVQRALKLYKPKKKTREIEIRKTLTTTIAKMKAGESGYKVNSAAKLRAEILALEELL